MANKGKYYDRSPIICPAGKVFTKPGQSVAHCMNIYPLNDQVDALKHDVGVFKEKDEKFEWKQQRMINTRHQGVETEAWPAMRPPVKTRYQELINELKETSYDSSWNKLLSKTRDATGNLPPGINPEEETYGSPPIKEVGVKELVNPSTTTYEVLWNSQIAHDLYRKSHNDYNPCERVDRGYYKPPYDPKKCYGERSIYDPRGIWVRCACQWHYSESVVAVSKIQADVGERTKHQLGKSLCPNKNIKCVPMDHRFGKKTVRHLYGMEELLKDYDCPPCLFKRDFLIWMKTLNELREYIHKRREGTGRSFSLKLFYNTILYYDKGVTGWIPKDILYKISQCKGLSYEPKLLEPLLMLLGILREDGSIHYGTFIQLIDKNKPVPEIVKIPDIPPENQYYLTTNQAAQCDYLIINNTGMPMAGIPSERYDLPHPAVRPGECKADLDSLGEETTAHACINPSIYTNYGLNHRDFFKPREADVIRGIFENIGYKFTDDSFKKYWELGVEHDKTGLVCVSTFKKLLKEHLPPLPYFPKAEKLIDLKYCCGYNENGPEQEQPNTDKNIHA